MYKANMIQYKTKKMQQMDRYKKNEQIHQTDRSSSSRTPTLSNWCSQYSLKLMRLISENINQSSFNSVV